MYIWVPSTEVFIKLPDDSIVQFNFIFCGYCCGFENHGSRSLSIAFLSILSATVKYLGIFV